MEVVAKVQKHYLARGDFGVHPAGDKAVVRLGRVGYCKHLRRGNVDFDADGDLDIASASFFPDYGKSPRESFVYLESKGGLKFEPSTFRQCIGGRWMTLDAADMDGDGDIDVLSASYDDNTSHSRGGA